MKRIFLLLSVLILSEPTRAVENQVENRQRAERSVYVINVKNDFAIIGLSSALSLALQYNANHFITRRCPCDSSEVNSLDRGTIGNSNEEADRASDVILASSIIAPIAIDWFDVGHSTEFVDDMIIYVEVMSVNTALTSLSKTTFQRPRPRSYAGDPDYVNQSEGYESFYSGHTSATFAALSAASMTLRYRHPEFGNWPWIITGIVGGSMAYERVAAGLHFPTDVLMGAFAGTAVGIIIPYSHLKKMDTENTFLVLPSADGAMAMWKFKF